METLKRQASKFREQVTKQHHLIDDEVDSKLPKLALRRQLGHFDGEAFAADDAEVARHQQLQNLYISTRAAKHFEKDIVRGIEGIISVTSKEIDIDRRYAQDCSKYEAENHCSTSTLSDAAMHICASRNLMIKEKETLLGIYNEQVCKPMRALIRSAELEDGRLLIRRYEKLWQEVEAQAAEVVRLRAKSTEGPKFEERSIKLQIAEQKLDELRSRLMSLGKEASSAMLSVEAQQQRMTFQQLVVMMNAERSFHRNNLLILDKLLSEMGEVEQQSQSSSAVALQSQSSILGTEGHANSNGNKVHVVELDETACFLAKVVHPFDGEAEGELSLLVDDIVIVHQVMPAGGWSKGECNGKTGWFPSPYVQKMDAVSTSNHARASRDQ